MLFPSWAAAILNMQYQWLGLTYHLSAHLMTGPPALMLGCRVRGSIEAGEARGAPRSRAIIE
jgi:hypothetical protein